MLTTSDHQAVICAECEWVGWLSTTDHQCPMCLKSDFFALPRADTVVIESSEEPCDAEQ